jgi:hypothetical protein
VKVSLEDGVLAIEGERKQEKEEKGRKFHRIERATASSCGDSPSRPTPTRRRSVRSSRTAC